MGIKESEQELAVAIRGIRFKCTTEPDFGATKLKKNLYWSSLWRSYAQKFKNCGASSRLSMQRDRQCGLLHSPGHPGPSPSQRRVCD
jgi:hypothetical protein